ncbi:hypothetical protein HRbin11_02127 [bacterium HR11]|nr:hypothetical protein HRbin11_02127 [bacterium HR11]
MKGRTSIVGPRIRSMAGWVALMALLAIGPGRPEAVASDFEGVILYQVTTPEATAEVTYSIKGHKARWEPTSFQSKKSPSGAEGKALQGYIIVDTDAGTMTTVMPTQKMYMVMNYREMTRSLSQEETRPEKFPKIVQTGRKETVAGYPCEHWLFGEGSQQVDMCLAQGLGFFGMGGQGGRAGLGAAFPSLDRAKLAALLAAHPELKGLVEGGAFPLKVEAKDATWVVTKIERKPLSDDLFRPPAGYQEMNWEKMMPPMRKPPR